MSSLVQKSNYSGYRKYGHAQYRGILHGSVRRSNTCSAKILFMIDLRSSRSSATGSQWIRILIRAIETMLETSNALQRASAGRLEYET